MADRVLPDVRELDALGLVARGLAVLPDLKAARRIADILVRRKEERAVFGLCLLTLEMAILGDARARRELPVRVPVLFDAFRDSALAARLTGEDPEVQERWRRVRPLMEQFVAGRTPGVPPLDPHPPAAIPAETPSGPPAAAPAASLPPPPAVSPAPPPAPPQPGPGRQSPSLAPDASRSEVARGGTRAASGPEIDAFWRFAIKMVGRSPSRIAGSGADRQKLEKFAADLLARFPECAPAEALASMTLLFVATHQKEQGPLLHPARLEPMRAGLSLLSSWDAAADVAALIEAEGPETHAAFREVVDLVGEYLAFCLAQQLDPLDTRSPARFGACA